MSGGHVGDCQGWVSQGPRVDQGKIAYVARSSACEEVAGGSSPALMILKGSCARCWAGLVAGARCWRWLSGSSAGSAVWRLWLVGLRCWSGVDCVAWLDFEGGELVRPGAALCLLRASAGLERGGGCSGGGGLVWSVVVVLPGGEFDD